MRLILCYLLGLVLTLVTAVPPENCPDEYDPICRTDYRYRVSHDWIPYANASSGDGIKWRVLVDQHDYQNIFGPFFFPAGKWKELDADGDGLNWVHGSGGTCTYQVRVNSYRRPNSNNWYFTQALSYCDAEELIVNASVRFSSCTQRPDCIHDYVYLRRFDTNSPNEDERIKPENYNYYLENEEDSKLKQVGTTSDTEIIEYFRRPDTSHTYFGIQDIGTTGQVQRFMVYYKVCQKNQVGLAIYPEVPLPPHTSGPSDRIMRLARCVAHAHNITSLETYAYKDQCMQNVECDCDPGYERSADSTACIPCTEGYYKSLLNSTCVPCPMNSNSDKDGADHCECIDGYYRAPNEGVGKICTAPPDPIPNKLRIVGMCDTTAELSWDKPEKVGREDFYYSINRTNPDTSEEIMIDTHYIDDSDVVTFRVTGLAPKTTYTFTVCVHNGVSQFDQINEKLRVVAQQATTRQGSVFMHNNMELSNNSVVLREEIGEGEKALICQTLSDAQCGSSVSPAMFFPNSTKVLPDGNGHTVYSTTGDGQVRLNRKMEDGSPLGSYYCQIPDSEGNIQKMFVRIATIEQMPCSGQCPPLQPPRDGSVSYDSTSPGSIAIYRCDDGTVTMRFCSSDGQWSGDKPTCESAQIMCPAIESPANGDVTVSGFTTGSVASYTCNINYLLDGSSTRVCGSDGQWSAEAPICRQVDCGELSDIPNGEVDYTSSTVGSTATYTCNTGFELVGQRSRSCQSSGIWEGTVPSCQRIDCGSLVSPINGQISVSSTTIGSTASYTCSSGYSLSGATVRTCQANGQWSGTAPVCVPVPSSSIPPPATTQQPTPSTPPPPPTGLRIELNGRVHRNGSMVYIDDIGEDNNALICYTSRLDCCSTIGSRHGEFYYPNGTLVGIKSKNEAMYRNRGSQLIRLNRNSGSGSLPPMGWYRCEIPTESGEQQSISINIAARPGERPVVCPQLNDLIGGSVTISDDALVPGTKAMYSCDDKHRLSGPFVRECQEDGTWSESEPTCEVIICPALTPPDNGNVNQLGNTPGGLAIYACNDNFELSGDMSRECGPNGQWTGEAPLCEATISCPPLEHPANGLVTLEENSPGSVATYSCDEDHSLLGSATSLCQSNGAWSNQPPTCAKIGFQLNGQFHASGSSLSLSSIGEGEGALLCVTDGTCCTPPNRAGEFYYPDNTAVHTEGSGDDLYRDRGEQMIRLHRRNGATSPTGTYKCEIPDSSGDSQEIFITLN